LLYSFETDFPVARGALDVFLSWTNCCCAVVVDKMKVLVISYHYKLINQIKVVVMSFTQSILKWRISNFQN